VQCRPGDDPPVDAAPDIVLVRLGRLAIPDLQQLRRILHALVTSAPRMVTVELADLDADHRANVLAILVAAARKARGRGSTIRVHSSPVDQRRPFAVAGIDESSVVAEPEYTLTFGAMTTPVAAAVVV
jgi:hypothetical protein